jgi:uncharacterized protein (TIGR00269 family)
MLCSVCKRRPPAVMQAYAARELCEGCFIKHFEERVRRTISEFGMISRGDKIAIALSGGKDSVVLMHILAGMREKRGISLHAIAIDEGIAGYRPKTLKTARRECKKLGIPLEILSFKKGAGATLDCMMKKQDGACSWCGVFRRRLLNAGAREIRADKIAIGHNLDDTAQTILMNMMRNEPERLARYFREEKSDSFVPRIRPLMRTPEKEVAAYALLRGMGIEYNECPYAYQSFRQHVKTQLNATESKYPGTKQRILNSMLGMLAKMPKEKGGALPCRECGEPSPGGTCMACKMAERLQESGVDMG